MSGYELSALCRIVIYGFTALVLVYAAYSGRGRWDGHGVLVMCLLLGNSVLGFIGVSRDVVGAVATPISVVIVAYVLLAQRRPS